MTAISMGSTIAGEGPPQLRKLFIGGLNHETTDEQVCFDYAFYNFIQ